MGERHKGASTSDDELVDLIYAALLGESSWQRFLDRLADSTPTGKTVLILHDNNKDDGYIPLASGISPDTLKNYNGYYSKINPFMVPASLRPIGIGFTDDELAPRRELERTEFFNDLLSPNEMCSRVSITIGREAEYQFILATLGSNLDQECKKNTASQLTRIYPHLKRAAKYYRKGSDTQAASELGASILDAIDIGVMLVSDGFRIRARSEVSDILVQQTSVLSVSPLGTISIRDEDAQTLLLGMLSRTYSGPKIANRITKGVRLTFVRIARDEISDFFDGPTVVILIELAYREKKLDVSLFSNRYNLTKSEIRALKGIIYGKTMKVIAKESGVSHETIRSQVKSVYAKTGSHSQSDLLRLINFGIRF